MAFRGSGAAIGSVNGHRRDLNLKTARKPIYGLEATTPQPGRRHPVTIKMAADDVLLPHQLPDAPDQSNTPQTV